MLYQRMQRLLLATIPLCLFYTRTLLC